MSSIKQDDAAPTGYWRSLDELADSPDFRRFVENEFPASADKMLEPGSRREFLKLMGASMALAGMTACRWPKEEILPFSERPENTIPGTPRHYATALQIAGVASGVVVASYDGRPVKIEGNERHPDSLGASGILAQASLLELYDPERSHDVQEGETVSDWSAFERFAADHFGGLRADGGRGLRVLAGADGSPTLRQMRERFARAFPQARWVEYEAVSRDNVRDGMRMVWGRPMRPHWKLDAARVIVSFEDDFVVQHPNAVRYARDYVKGRHVVGGGGGHGGHDAHDSHDKPASFNRLYVFEGCHTVTGSIADRRVTLDTDRVPAYVGCLAARLFLDEGVALPGGAASLRNALAAFRSHALFADLDDALVADLLANRGASLITVGAGHPPEVHALVALVNMALGNHGATLTYTPGDDAGRTHHHTAIAELVADMRAGRVDTLVVLDGNPVYDAPADLDFAAALDGVAHVIRAGRYVDETSAAAAWHLPLAHPLESWNDARSYSGVYSVGQPLIEPLGKGRTPTEIVSLLVGEKTSGHDAVRATFAETFGESAWRGALHDGLVEDSGRAAVDPGAPRDGWAGALAAHAVGNADGLRLVFLVDPRMRDGRFANNGWLQELPDTLTKLTWDNAALVGPETADSLGVGQGEMLRVEHAGHAVELPVYVLPGQAPRTIGVWLGYGRRRGGQVAVGTGFDVYPLRTTQTMHSAPIAASAAGGSYKLATTQNHWAIDALGSGAIDKRAPILIREIELADLGKHDDHHGAHPEVDLWEPHAYDGYKWGMAIDLNDCVGCNACIVACQAENNIPVVGKDEVARGREMHWLRVDRYFQGDPASPRVAYQPMPCQHCENAPCEQVCPVQATVHDAEGLNVMVYNRCVGTRYCSNNCPYKVRRFNYFNNHKNESALETMIYNPNVTVRSRGVMEKCTFCTQRIASAKIAAGNAKRKVADGEIVPACAQACPTQAITFGDLNDESSRVAKRHHDPRAYTILEETNVKPRVRYLKKVRNTGSNDHGDAAHAGGEA